MSVSNNNITLNEPLLPRNTLTINERIVFLRGKVSVKKIKAQRSIDFITSLDLKAIPPEKQNKHAAEIGHYIYIFEVNQNNEQKWIIRKRLKDFSLLSKHVKEECSSKQITKQIPEIPGTSDKKSESGQEFLTFFEMYLNEILKLAQVQDCNSLLTFLEISSVNYEGAGQKYKEAYVRKRAGGRFNENFFLLRCGAMCRCWNKRYMIITSEGIMYARGHSDQQSYIRESLLFDYHFKFDYGSVSTGIETGIILNYSNRKLRINALDIFSFYDILAALIDAYKNSPYVQIQRFNSFSPVREKSECKWYVDGEHYYADLFTCLMGAKNDVFITDWWLSPELFLKRPVSKEKNQETRIDRVLNTIASRGVNVRIIVYSEPTMALTLDSLHTQQHLQSLHPNITVLRHPGNLFPILWSHHEKLVVIDQEIGFMGGLDLCYGRMDTNGHALFDIKLDVNAEISIKKEEFFPGIDYSNSRKKDFYNVRKFECALIEKDCEPRMPWHDIAMQIRGEPVRDMARHFIQYWNFVKVDLNPNEKKEKLILKEKKNEIKEEERIQKEEEGLSAIEKMKRKWIRFKKKHIHTESTDVIPAVGNDPQAKHEENQHIFVSAYPVLQNDGRNNQPESKLGAFGKRVREAAAKKRDSTKPDLFDIYLSNLLEINKSQKESVFSGPKQPKEGPIKEEDDMEESKEDSKENQRSVSNGKGKRISGKNASMDIDLEDNKRNSKQNNNKTSGRVSTTTFSGKSEFKWNQIRAKSKSILNAEKNDFQLDNGFLNILKKLKEGKQSENELNNSDYFQRMSDMKFEQREDVVNMEIDIKEGHNKDNQPNTIVIPDYHIKDKKKGIMEAIKDKKKEKNFLSFSQNIDTKAGIRSFLHHQDSSEEDNINIINRRLRKEGSCKCQMLRSSSLWSMGLKTMEDSIHIAYIGLISNAQHFIYIENQFFISSLAGNPVKNLIAYTLVERIKKAAANNENFKVIVVMPLLPVIFTFVPGVKNSKVLLPTKGFEGEINQAGSAVMKVQLHWEYQTISRGGNSLYEELKKDPNITDPFKFIRFYGLRTHALDCNNTPKTEMIYVHSKLMIVDDRIVIMGSANINDRSLLGSRDSEIAMVIEDQKTRIINMDGKQFPVAEFAHSLRLKIFNEHFGLSEPELTDPVSDEMHRFINDHAKRNTEIYRTIFACYPDDNIKKLTQFDDFVKSGKPERYPDLKDEIFGHAVEFPLDFLQEERLTFRLKQKEYFVPDHNFT